MGKVPAYRKHKGSGQAVVTLGGKDHYLGKHGSAASKAAYGRLIAEFQSSGCSTSFGVPAEQVTVNEMLVAYLKHAQGYYTNRKTYKFQVLAIKPLKALYGRTAVSEFGPLQFKAVRQSLIGENRSRNYINDTMARIRGVFKWATSEAMIPPEIPVYQNLRAVDALKCGRSEARETEPVKPVPDSSVDATLPHLPSVVADMVRLQRLLGCRPGELCKIKPSMVDRSNEVWEIRLAEHKTAHRGKERVIYVGPQAQRILSPFLLRGADEYCFSPKDSERKRRTAQHEKRVTPLSCGCVPGSNVVKKPKRRPGNRYLTVGFARAIGRACEKAGIESWSPNQLRHSAGTKVRKELGIESAAAILGHADIQTTKIYAEKDRQLGIEAARKLG